MLGFFPYIRIPTRYILPENQTVRIAVLNNMTIESSNCHSGTSNGRRTIMTMGEVSGIIEHQNANGPSGLFILYMPAYNEKTINTIIGDMNWDESS